ncbi:RhoGAP domain-containing protein [Balamuthia mandrillaris]
MELTQQEHMEVPYAIEGTFLELFEKIPIPPPNDELGQDLFKYPTVLWEASEALQKMALLLRREENKVLFVEEGGLQLLAQVLQFCEGPLAPGDPPGKELLLQRTRKYCMKAVKRFKRELESYKIIGLSDKEVAVLRGAVSRSILLGSARTKEVSDERHTDHLPSDGRALIEMQAAQYANDAVLPQQEAATEEKQSITDEQATPGQKEKLRVAEITSSPSQVERRASAEMARQSTIEKEAGEGIVRKSSTTQQQPQRLKPLPASPLAQRAEGIRPVPPQADSRPYNAPPRHPMAHTNEREPIKVVPSISVQQRASVMPVMGVMPMPSRQQASAKPSPFPTAVSAPTPVPLPTTITLAVPDTHMNDDEKDTRQKSSAKKKVLIHSRAPLQSRPKYLERESPSTELDALLTRLVQESDIASRYEVVRDHFNYLRVETKNKKYSAKPVVLACTGSALYCIDATTLAGVECGWTYDQIHAVRIDDSSLNAPINNLGEELAEPLSMFNGEPLRLICIALQQGGLHHFVEHRRADLKDLLQCINRGRLSIATIKQVQLCELAPTSYSFLQPHGMDLFTNKSKIEPVLEALAVAGFTEQDIWEGNLDLPKVIQQFKETALQDVFQQRDKDYVVIFLLPEGDAFGGLFRKLYRVGSNVPVKKVKLMPYREGEQILRTLCNRLNVDPQKYCLTTLSGCPISSEEVLASYGLGSLFENWQLKLIENGQLELI